MTRPLPIIGITMGDAAGVGSEIYGQVLLPSNLHVLLADDLSTCGQADSFRARIYSRLLTPDDEMPAGEAVLLSEEPG